LSSFHLLYCIYLLYVSFYSFVSATLRGEIKLCVSYVSYRFITACS